jgi:hypothetical protein
LPIILWGSAETEWAETERTSRLLNFNLGTTSPGCSEKFTALIRSTLHSWAYIPSRSLVQHSCWLSLAILIALVPRTVSKHRTIDWSEAVGNLSILDGFESYVARYLQFPGRREGSSMERRVLVGRTVRNALSTSRRVDQTRSTVFVQHSPTRASQPSERNHRRCQRAFQ